MHINDIIQKKGFFDHADAVRSTKDGDIPEYLKVNSASVDKVPRKDRYTARVLASVDGKRDFVFVEGETPLDAYARALEELTGIGYICGECTPVGAKMPGAYVSAKLSGKRGYDTVFGHSQKNGTRSIVFHAAEEAINRLIYLVRIQSD